MSFQDLGAIGEVVSAIAVVVSLIYLAYQIRQSSRQIEQNSRHLEASMYHATNEDFFGWFSLLAQDEKLAALWRRALVDEASLSAEDVIRVNSLVAMLFLTYENNFQQFRLGAVKRDTLAIAAPDISALLSRPFAEAWWKRQGVRMLTPEFRSAVDSVVAQATAARDEAQRRADRG